jgi:hypoxanthine-guanine phosphoribosyltransferase
VSVEADYTGFTIDDHFVVGYGLTTTSYRNLRDIVVYGS